MIPRKGKDCVTLPQAEAYFLEVFVRPVVDELIERIVDNRATDSELAWIHAVGWKVRFSRGES